VHIFVFKVSKYSQDKVLVVGLSHAGLPSYQADNRLLQDYTNHLTNDTIYDKVLFKLHNILIL